MHIYCCIASFQDIVQIEEENASPQSSNSSTAGGVMFS